MNNCKCLRTLVLLGATATLAFAQTSSFGQAAQGIATEMIAIAKLTLPEETEPL